MLINVLQLVQVLSTARDDSSDPTKVRESVDQAMVSNTRARAHARLHARTHTHTHTHACTPTHAHTHAHTHTHTHLQHTLTHTHTHTHTRTHTCTHTAHDTLQYIPFPLCRRSCAVLNYSPQWLGGVAPAKG